MKRRDLEREVRWAANAVEKALVVKHGGKHDKWMVGAVTTTVPRHSEIPTGMADAIRKDFEPELGKNWWR